VANPQLEDGYTRIVTKILEKLAGIRIPGQAWQVLMVIIRKTYGFQKKTDYISLSQFHELTYLPESNISRAANTLLRMNLIIKKDKGNKPTYRFNKDYDTWIPLPKKIRGQQKLTKKDNQDLSKKRDTIDTITKDNNIPAMPDSIKPIQKKTDKVYRDKWEYVNIRFQQIMNREAPGNVIGSLLKWGRDVGETVTAIYKVKEWINEDKFIGAIRNTLRERGKWSEENMSMVKMENNRFSQWLGQRGMTMGDIIKNLR